METEPLLQPLTGEKRTYKTSIKEDNARHELSAFRFWRHDEKTFFVLKMLDPIAQSHFNQNLQYKLHTETII